MYLALINFATSQRKLQLHNFCWFCCCAKLTKLSPQGMTGKGITEKVGPRNVEDKVEWPCPISHSSVR